jgi:predicted nuclease with TOPRIM domain
MKELEELERQITKTEEALKKVRGENAKLQDEVDSLWSMMDEITESDIEKYSYLLKELKTEMEEKALMTTKKVADC